MKQTATRIPTRQAILAEAARRLDRPTRRQFLRGPPASAH